jgi:class 3 adenylate cyclase
LCVSRGLTNLADISTKTDERNVSFRGATVTAKAILETAESLGKTESRGTYVENVTYFFVTLDDFTKLESQARDDVLSEIMEQLRDLQMTLKA